jgi:hypothetical protein
MLPFLLRRHMDIGNTPQLQSSRDDSSLYPGLYLEDSQILQLHKVSFPRPAGCTVKNKLRSLPYSPPSHKSDCRIPGQSRPQNRLEFTCAKRGNAL